MPTSWHQAPTPTIDGTGRQHRAWLVLPAAIPVTFDSDPGTVGHMGVSSIDDGSRHGAGGWRWSVGDVKMVVGAVLAAVLVMGVVVRFWALIGAVLIIAFALWLIHDSSVQRQARRDLEDRRRADLRSRADAEHQAFLRGERRGLYGQYEPPEL